MSYLACALCIYQLDHISLVCDARLQCGQTDIVGDRSAPDLTLSAAQKADLVIQASYKYNYKSDYKSDHELTNGKRKSAFKRRSFPDSKSTTGRTPFCVRLHWRRKRL